MVRKWLKRTALAIAVLILALALFVVVTPQGRAAAKTVGLVLQVLPTSPVKPLGWFTVEPVRTAVAFPTGAREAEADVYRTHDDGQRAAVVLFLGVNPAGREDERVVNLALGLARAGFVVLVPWSENMVSKRMDPSDIELLVAAFQYLKTLDYVDPERLGAGGFCVGSSLLVVAASDPRIRDDVDFINFFSGFYDLRDFLRQRAARASFYGDTVEDWEPDKLTLEVSRILIVESLPERSEREALEAHFTGGATLTAREAAGLSQQARAVYRLLSGTTLEEADQLIGDLPPALLDDMDALSPSKHLEGLKARLLIMHDREDALAPIEESRRLADALAERGDARFTEFSFFQHVDPTERVGLLSLLRESFKLYRHLYSVVRVAT